MADSGAAVSAQKNTWHKDAVVVLGMHRSGTSALSRLLTELGFAQAVDVMPPQADNPLGFWEPVEIVRFNERLLKSCGSGWSDASALWIDDGSAARPGVRIPKEFIENHLAEAVGLLQASYATERICIKDPRLPLLFELWAEAFDRAGIRPHLVFIYRDPLEVFGSLRHRNAMDMPTALRLFVKHIVAILQAIVAAQRVAAVDFATLRSDPGGEAQRLVDHFEGSAIDLPEPDPATIGGLVAEDAVHVRAPRGAIDRLPRSPVCDLVRQTDRLVRRYLATGHLPASAVEVLNGEFVRHCVHNGHLNPLYAPQRRQPAADPPRRARTTQPARRKVIMHYHLFKNAGTSVDAVLKQNFDTGWVTREFDGASLERNKAEMIQWIVDAPDAIAFSSHTALAVVRRIDDIEVFPVLFIRHPLERIHSAYLFERKQEADTDGARLAKQKDFAGYVRTRLEQPKDYAIRDFQARRLASWLNATDRLALVNAALAAVDTLPFIGLVERFDASMERLRDWLCPHFPKFQVFPVHKNVSRDDTTMEERSADIVRLLGPELFHRLVEENQADMAVYEAVKARHAGLPA